MNETTQIIMKQLNSKIIQGPIGPTGPQGPKGDKGDGTGGSGIIFEALANGETVTIDNSVTPTVPTVPSIPMGLSANPQNTQVTLTWSAVSGATGYKVYRNGTLIASPTSASCTDTALTNGTQYSYAVSAVNAVGESAQSSAVTATPVAPSLPSAPTGLAATAGDAQVSLAWNTVSGATSYKLYRDGSLIASPTAANYTDTGRTNGVAYSYTASAVNGAGESAQSGSVSATPSVATASYVSSGLTHNWNNLISQTTVTDDGTYIPASGDWTLCATFKHQDYLNIFSKWVVGDADNCYRIFLDDSPAWHFSGLFYDGSPSSGERISSTTDTKTGISTGTYMHVALICSAGVITMRFNDAVQGGSLPIGTLQATAKTTIKIGDATSDIKAMYLYNRALTTSELTQNYNALI